LLLRLRFPRSPIPAVDTPEVVADIRGAADTPAVAPRISVADIPAAALRISLVDIRAVALRILEADIPAVARLTLRQGRTSPAGTPAEAHARILLLRGPPRAPAMFIFRTPAARDRSRGTHPLLQPIADGTHRSAE
jgi:hypothetical protein